MATIFEIRETTARDSLGCPICEVLVNGDPVQGDLSQPGAEAWVALRAGDDDLVRWRGTEQRGADFHRERSHDLARWTLRGAQGAIGGRARETC
jgi:hypothetical protein